MHHDIVCCKAVRCLKIVDCFLRLQVTNLAEEVEALRRQVTEGEHAQKVS